MTEQFIKTSTKSLQVESLLALAKTLGYVPKNPMRLSRGFETMDFRSWHTHYISFPDMCKLHNGFLHRKLLNLSGNNSYDFIELHYLDINTDTLEKAWLKRKVKRVKLQPTKDKSIPDGVICQEDMVEYIK